MQTAGTAAAGTVAHMPWWLERRTAMGQPERMQWWLERRTAGIAAAGTEGHRPWSLERRTAERTAAAAAGTEGPPWSRME